MAWIKIGEHDVLNANAVKAISIEQHREDMYYIKFSLYECDSILSKRFKQYEECRELFNRIWSAMADDRSIDVS